MGAVVGVVAAIALGPAGLAWATSSWALGAIGGAVGGAVTGALQGGLRGALIGGITGGVLGGIGGWGVGEFGKGFGYGMLAAGGAYSASTGNLDSFAGGLAGGYAAFTVASGINSYLHDPLSSQDPKGGIQSGKEGVVEGRGVGTTAAKALKVANETGNRVLYTQSRSIGSDIVRGGLQLLLGNSHASRQFAQYMLAHPNTIYNLHSEMTLTALGAARTLQYQGVEVSAHFNLTSAFYSEATAQSVFNSVGASVNFVPPNIADSAGMFSSSNPVIAPIYGVLGILTGEVSHAYEAYKHYE